MADSWERRERVKETPRTFTTFGSLCYYVNRELAKPWGAGDFATGRTVWFSRATPINLLQHARVEYLKAGYRYVYVMETSDCYALEFWAYAPKSPCHT